MKKDRLIYLDVLRGIAIILIVIGHMERGLVEGGVTTAKYVEILDKLIYAIHLPMLFILSGIVEFKFNSSKNNNFKLKDFIKRNIIALYFPYLIFIYGYWFIKMYIFSGNHETNFNDIYTLFYSGKWVFWFLLALLLIKIMYCIIEKNKSIKFLNNLLWIAIYITVLIVNDYYNLNIKIIDWLSYGLFYALGYKITEYNIIEKMRKKTLSVITVSLIIIVCGLLYFNITNKYIDMITIGIPVTTILLILFYKIKKLKFLQICGKYSMVIYLMHTLFTSASRVLLLKIGITNFFILLSIGTMISIIISLSIVFIYRNIKMFNFIEYLFYPNKLIERRKA